MTFDCGIAALAMYTGRSYGDVVNVARRLYPKVDPQKYGLFNRELVVVAHHLGLPLEQRRTRSVDASDEGVLRVRWNGEREKEAPGGHFVVLRHGTVLCHEVGLRTWDDYRTRYDCRPCTLLKVSA
jgi:hypothetical protein